MFLLSERNDDDHFLPKNESGWIEVGPFAIYIIHRETCMQVEIYENGNEMGNILYEYTFDFPEQED
jgi:hypothetical protein